MELRQFGANDPLVGALGLGSLRMTPFVKGAKPFDESEGIATIHAALDAGVRLLNTGDFYTMGINEMLVGTAKKSRRDEALVSVKFGALGSTTGAFLGFDMRPNAVKNFCTYSLQRLGVDVIDLYQPARVDPGVPLEDTVGAVADLIEEGKVRHLGVSEHNADQPRRAQAVTALEIEYSLASRYFERESLPTARELGVGIVAYSVVTQGLLTGTFPSELPPGNKRQVFPRFQGGNLRNNLSLVEELKWIADAKGATPAQVAIAWVLAQGRGVVPNVGISSRQHLPKNREALEVHVSVDDLDQSDKLFHVGAGGATRPRSKRSSHDNAGQLSRSVEPLS